MSATDEDRDIIEVIRKTVLAVLKSRKFYTVRFELYHYELAELKKDFKITKTGKNYTFKIK